MAINDFTLIDRSCYSKRRCADMAELVDAPVLGTGFARSEGSSPFIRILKTSESNDKSTAYSLYINNLFVVISKLLTWLSDLSLVLSGVFMPFRAIFSS